MVKAVVLAVLDRGETLVRLNSQKAARLLVRSGEPLGEPVVGQGRFAMNSREEIRHALDAYQQARMGRLEPLPR